VTWLGTALMLTGATSNQLGAGVAAHAFPAIGPAGVVAVRQVVASVVLLAVSRPDPRRMTWAQWWPVLLLAGVFAGMNLSLYTAVDRVGLGLAVTLEFLGPLAVALVASRTRTHLATAALAAAGVYVLVDPGPTSDLVGIALGLAAACCWAAYIVVGRECGRRMPGLQGAAVASTVSAVAYLPVLVVLLADGRLAGTALWLALATGVLSSVVPYAADLTALRYVPARHFGVFMSVHPVLAALVGLVVLGQVLDLHEWTGIALVVGANVVAATTSRDGLRRSGSERADVTRPGDRHAVVAVGGEHLGGEHVAVRERLLGAAAAAPRGEVAGGEGVARADRLDDLDLQRRDDLDAVRRERPRRDGAVLDHELGRLGQQPAHVVRGAHAPEGGGLVEADEDRPGAGGELAQAHRGASGRPQRRPVVDVEGGGHRPPEEVVDEGVAPR
jgi:inner membrane transporter RhtA